MSSPRSELNEKDTTASIRPTSLTPSTVVEETAPTPITTKKPLAFWLVFLAVCVACFLSAFELTSIGTALPTIVSDLNGQEYVWVGGAYAASSTAFLPMSGGLANIFGRRSIMLAVLLIFAIGSAICGAATNLNMLIAGRAVQGIGGGGIISMAEIIIADLVPLRERGKFAGFLGAVWSLASVLGPPLGGVLASAGQWRWLFYLNLPLCAVAAGLVIAFLNLRTPRDSFKEKMAQMDWFGNFIIIASTISVILALTTGGVKHPWSSYQVLVPLILGLVGMAGFLLYEARYAKEPVVPFDLFESPTSLSGYFGTFIHGIVTAALIYYLPVYFESAKQTSAQNAGIRLFGTALTIAPFAVICGISVEVFGRYVPQNYIGWVIAIIGAGVLSILDADSSTAMGIGLQVVVGVAYGFLYSSTTFPVLAPMPVKKNAHALALFVFTRSFGQTWGITIGATILQNQLKKKLPAGFLASFPSGAEIAYAVIPSIPGLPEPLRSQVKVAFADSISVIWLVSAGLAGLGLLSVFAMREVPMHVVTDENWGLENRSANQPHDVENQKLPEVSQ